MTNTAGPRSRVASTRAHARGVAWRGVAWRGTLAATGQAQSARSAEQQGRMTRREEAGARTLDQSAVASRHFAYRTGRSAALLDASRRQANLTRLAGKTARQRASSERSAERSSLSYPFSSACPCCCADVANSERLYDGLELTAPAWSKRIANKNRVPDPMPKRTGHTRGVAVAASHHDVEIVLV